MPPRLLVPLLLLGLALPASADVLVTTDGLRLEGEIHRDDGGAYVVRTPAGTTVLPADRVATFTPGEGARAALERRAATMGADDAKGWFALALEAEAEGIGDLARRAYGEVVGIQPDHEAARRALGQERYEGQWVDQAVARRRRGLVLYGGRWMLPAEVEAAARADDPAPIRAAPSDDVPTLIRTLAGGDAVLARAARLSLARVSDTQVVEAARATLFDAVPGVRCASARLLGEVGDEAALRPLIFSAARDLDDGVRAESLRAAMSFGRGDLSVPFVNALGSENLRLAGNAAQALGAIGDPRAIGYVVKRLTSHGGSTRNVVSVVNQVSYVQDYDVEIAQASNIANPTVATIQDGVVLDVRVLGSEYTRTWIEPLLVDAASRLARREFKNRDEVLRWYGEHQATLPDYADTAPPARTRGKVIGAQ